MSTAAAAAKSLRSCLTLCDPIDGSPPGSPVPGILQARTLEWVAYISIKLGKKKGLELLPLRLLGRITNHTVQRVVGRTLLVELTQTALVMGKTQPSWGVWAGAEKAFSPWAGTTCSKQTGLPRR